MLGSTFNAYVPYKISGLALISTGKLNDFDEEVGSIVAVTPNGKYLNIDQRDLLEKIGLCASAITSIDESITEKAALFDLLRNRKDITTIIVAEPSKGSKRSLSELQVIDYVFSKTSAEHFSSSLLNSIPGTRFNLSADHLISRLSSSNMDIKLAQSVYDMIAEILSYSSGGYTGALDRSSSYLQMIPNGIPISLKRYQEHPPLSPFNPQGDLTSTEEFANLASLTMDLNGRNNDKNLENIYGLIIHSSNTSQPLDENAIKVLEKVKEYLFVKMKDQFTGEEYITDSPAYANYKKAFTAYQLALAAYLGGRNKYDLTKPDDQRAWQLDSIMLQAKVDQAKNDLDAAGTTVTRALNYLKSYGRNAVQTIIAQAQDIFDKSSLNSQITPANKFHITYGTPSNWYEDDSGFTSVTFNSSQIKQDTSADSSSYGGGASYFSGLLSVGGNFSSSSTETRKHLETSDIKMSFKIATIQIQRPWLNSTLFDLEAWNLGGQRAGKISSGKPPSTDPDLNTRLLPFYSTALIIAKNIEISGNWSQSDYNFLSRSISGGVSVGFGPFTLGGANYSKQHTEEHFNSTFNNGTFNVPGAQVIGVINRVVPRSAPDNG